ncbi:hypothetical protein EDB94_0007 [Marinobacter sp. 3-2]|nr:hypothetical protein EDB94_0007 [Marinobacter sp. 3-2]
MGTKGLLAHGDCTRPLKPREKDCFRLFSVSKSVFFGFSAKVRILKLRKMCQKLWTHRGHNLDTGSISCARQSNFKSRAEVITRFEA